MTEAKISKQCLRCGIEKPLEAFTPQKHGKLGHTSQCKECTNARHRARRDEINPPHLRPHNIRRELLARGLKVCNQCRETKNVSEFHKVRRPDGYKPDAICKACSAIKYGKWFRANRQRRSDYHKEYRAIPENKTRRLRIRRARQSLSPREILQTTLRHGLHRRPTQKPATIDDIMEKWEAQKGCCALSGVKLTWGQGKVTPTSISLDRIDPDGGYSKDNVRLLCQAVNTFRGRMSDDEMLALAKVLITNMEAQRKLKIVS